MKQLTCEMCGSTEMLKQDGVFVCQTCGTKYSVEEAKKMMTNVTVNGDNVTVVIGNKNLEAMIEKGRVIADSALVSKEEGEELKRLSMEILDVDSGNFYGHFFAFASKLASGGAYDAVDFGNAMKKATTDEKTYLLEKAYSSLRLSISSFERLDDEAIRVSLIASGFGLFNLDAVGFLNYLIKTKDNLVVDYSAKLSELQGIVNSFIERCFLYARNTVKRYIFTEKSVEEYEFTNNICTMIPKLSILSTTASELICSDSAIYAHSKDIFNIINSNSSIIAKNQIYSKSLFESLKQLPGVDATHEISGAVTWQITGSLGNVTVIFEDGKMTIKDEGVDDRVIKAGDILKLNCSCRVNNSVTTDLYDIVYMLDEDTFTIVRLEVNNGDIYLSDNNQAAPLISWSTVNDIDISYEKWEDDIPLTNGFNGLEYKDTFGVEYCLRLDKGNFFKLQRDKTIFLNTTLFGAPSAIKYTDIVHVKIKNFTNSYNNLVVYSSNGMYFESALVGAVDLPKLNKFAEMLIEKAKVSGANYSETEPENAKKNGGCYVATCVYGSYDCPEVWTLRRYRDDTLGSTWYGRLFIRTYYAISPTLVKWFGKTKWFKRLWRGKLDRMVARLQSRGVENTPYEDKNW